MASHILSRRDLDFLLYEWLDAESLIQRQRFAEHSRETFDAVLDLCEQLATDKFANHNKKSDQNEPHYDGERVNIIPEVRQALNGKRTVLLGHSGVGKSTLVNALVGDDVRATGDVNAATGRGRHTSSSALALSLDENPHDAGSWIIDTPGVRSFGLAHVERDRVIRAFGEFSEAIEHCPRNCSHDEEDCALNHWEFSDESKARLANLRGLLNERQSE